MKKLFENWKKYTNIQEANRIFDNNTGAPLTKRAAQMISGESAAQDPDRAHAYLLHLPKIIELGVKFDTEHGFSLEDPNAADMISRKYNVMLSPEDKALQQKLYSGEASGQDEPKAPVSDKQSGRNAQMAKMIQSKIDSLDPATDAAKIEKLKAKMALWGKGGFFS